MRTLVLAMLAVSITLAPAAAAEKQTFLDGVVSVEVPSGWKTEMDERQLALSIILERAPGTRVIFSTPNLNTDGDASVLFERNLDLMYMFFGSDLNIISEEPSVAVFGKNGMQMDYTARRDGRSFRGRVFSFAEAGATVLAIFISNEDDFASHEQAFDAILSSFSVNADALNANRPALQEISDQADKLYNDLVEELEESYEEALAP